jgi:hypothetical protein
MGCSYMLLSNQVWFISCFIVWSPGQISDPSNGLYGAGAHTDYGLITLLATDDVYGLQVWKVCDDIYTYSFFFAQLN